MSDDPTRALPRDPKVPTHGSLGPADPTADPVTQPGMLPVNPGENPTVPTPIGGDSDKPAPPRPAPGRSRSGAVWTSVVLCAIVLVFLLIFILQNGLPVQINFLGLSGTLPTGVALLFAAIAGLLIGAIPGSVRILQLRRAARRNARSR